MQAKGNEQLTKGQVGNASGGVNEASHGQQVDAQEAELNTDEPVAKTIYLAQWVSHGIKRRQGNFVFTEDMYHNYKQCMPRGAHLGRREFTKQLESAMNTYHIMFIRNKFKTRWGYLGIECSGLPLSPERENFSVLWYNQTTLTLNTTISKVNQLGGFLRHVSLPACCMQTCYVALDTL